MRYFFIFTLSIFISLKPAQSHWPSMNIEIYRMYAKLNHCAEKIRNELIGLQQFYTECSRVDVAVKIKSIYTELDKKCNALINLGVPTNIQGHKEVLCSYCCDLIICCMEINTAKLADIAAIFNELAILKANIRYL